MTHRRDLLGLFAHHEVAANLLMIMMIIGGLFALSQLNIRFFPNFELDFINVRVVWSGASAEDVETGITMPLEQSLRSVDYLRNMTSTSSDGLAVITLELEEGSDVIRALNQVKQRVDEFRNLPVDAEEPEVNNVVRYEPVASLLLTGPDNVDELRQLAHRYEQQLLDRGIAQVDILGLPDQEIAIEISHQAQQHLGMSLDAIGDRIGQLSRDLPAGTFGERDNAHQLRSLEQGRSPQDFARLPVISDQHSKISLGTVADINRQPVRDSLTLSIGGKPAVELSVRRSETGDSLHAAKILQQWLDETRPVLPAGTQLIVYDESWKLIKERITLLLRNGSGGLVLVIGILYLFLSPRVAWWVALGIPVSFMATLLLLYAAGGSINMISLFGLIMALGIIVDDAIVVGEDALTHYQNGEQPLRAAEGGARRMLAPVAASSLTTVAAFLPLMLVSGPTGKVLFAIPLVVVTVILASLLESFFVLPGHLRHSFLHMRPASASGWRTRFDAGFARFRDHRFRRLVSVAIRHRGITISVVLALLILHVGLLAGGRLSFVFFPSPESTILYANARFSPGTPKATVDRFLRQLETSLQETDAALAPQPLVKVAVTRHGTETLNRRATSFNGDHLGSLVVELTEPDQREVRNRTLIRAWRERIRPPAGLESLSITERTPGPPGRDITVRFSGRNPEQIKAAALELEEALSTVAGVSDIEDDMPYGREQLVYRLTPTGEALGLSTAALGRQLRTAFDGRRVQLFQDGPDEVEVKVRLPRRQREQLNALEKLEIRLDSGLTVPLSTVAGWESRRGFEILRHADGKLAVEVSAEVDKLVNNPDRILASLRQGTLPQLEARYGVTASFEGRSADQKETLGDMKRGLIMGLTLIYLILAWVFASYGWPLLVMSAIPFGLIGALLGHFLLGIDLTILSLFGFFGLSGIVVNDSIILVSFYKQLRQQGLAVQEALVEAACQRLRAVLLTSMTTIAGLAPLLFETSVQAQFLIPMAVSIAFGLAFSTGLVLLVIPALLAWYEELRLPGFLRHKRPIAQNTDDSPS